MSINTKKVEKYVVIYVNRSRKKRGLNPLKSNYGLKKLARTHSKTMGRAGKIWHGKGVHLAGSRLSSKGILGFIASFFYKGTSGENVAMIGGGKYGNKSLAQNFHRMWMKSIGHRKNILNSSFNSIGIGIKKGRKGYFATEIFYG